MESLLHVPKLLWLRDGFWGVQTGIRHVATEYDVLANMAPCFHGLPAVACLHDFVPYLGVILRESTMLGPSFLFLFLYK